MGFQTEIQNMLKEDISKVSLNEFNSALVNIRIAKADIYDNIFLYQSMLTKMRNAQLENAQEEINMELAQIKTQFMESSKKAVSAIEQARALWRGQILYNIGLTGNIDNTTLYQGIFSWEDLINSEQINLSFDKNFDNGDIGNNNEIEAIKNLFTMKLGQNSNIEDFKRAFEGRGIKKGFKEIGSNWKTFLYDYYENRKIEQKLTSINDLFAPPEQENKKNNGKKSKRQKLLEQHRYYELYNRGWLWQWRWRDDKDKSKYKQDRESWLFNSDNPGESDKFMGTKMEFYIDDNGKWKTKDSGILYGIQITSFNSILSGLSAYEMLLEQGFGNFSSNSIQVPTDAEIEERVNEEIRNAINAGKISLL